MRPINTPAKFRAARQKMGISQVRLGEALGRSERSIRDYESGQAGIDKTLDLAMRHLLDHPPQP